MTITFTKEQVDLGRMMTLLEDLRILLRRIVKATVEDEPHRELLRAVERIEKEIKEAGYKGTYLDVAAYTEARFRQEDEGE